MSDSATSVVRTGLRHRPYQISGRYFIHGTFVGCIWSRTFWQ